MMKKLLLGLWFSVLLAAISVLFWKNEYQYSLPTPIPSNYHPIAMGSKIDLKCCTMDQKPVFVHFFNPECPCSRFNIPYVAELIKKYGDRINFKIVVINNEKSVTIKEIQQKFDAKIPVYFDPSIAKNCGVFSTPQAALIDSSQKLYFRGNYNKTRYCTDAETNYAQQAIEMLLKKTSAPSFDAFALRAYGCSLPKCTK
ncbi:redoxin domain-containing protein [Flavobacterium sp. KACC 22761]|uniref:TlpA family protein disulfide reductase n=1 Tax=Flavobacterium sp. KACC 22761 TaxID=3092665 RepID=UPI002A751695|nr:redoxin domain-containing protein [Flavobacterium sp. KACC 22761]WPO77934.1 redoxin domain-containing protein [Flavobacterium sp. KACC 22761]